MPHHNENSTNEKSSNAVSFLYEIMKTRDPNKRRVKPIEKTNELMDLMMDETSSSDSDYRPKSDAEDHDDDLDDDDDDYNATSNNVDADDDDDDDDDDSDESEDDENEKNNNNIKVEKNEMKDIDNNISNLLKYQAAKLLICSVCSGDVSHEQDEIVECDSCGITVHESCYGIINESDDNESVHSNVSSASTEPWFCDKCKADAKNVHCDLCPNLEGIYKQTDVGNWVHLVCALYIPGVAFSDTQRLKGVTLFELPVDRWGSKSCSLCEDERYSRTGICISCDAGMCKTYFHVTCAQRDGFLSEAQSTEETDLVDPFFAHCKFHSVDKSSVKNKRRNWLALQSRMKAKRELKTEPLNERITRKLEKARSKYKLYMETKPIPWIPSQKIPRLLITSPSAMRNLIKKSELHGLNPQPQCVISQEIGDIRRKWHVAPAFSLEFVSYFLDRNSRMISMQNRSEELMKQNRSLKETEIEIRKKYDSLLSQINDLREDTNIYREDMKKIWLKLNEISRIPLPLPKIIENEPPTSNFTNNNIKKGGPPSVFDSESNETGFSSAAATPLPVIILECGICRSKNDQHQLVLCDSCKLHYHLYCLDPPLTRMPKKTRFGGWECSECTEKIDDELNKEIIPEIEKKSNRNRILREHVKGPNKFDPDADSTSLNEDNDNNNNNTINNESINGIGDSNEYKKKKRKSKKKSSIDSNTSDSNNTKKKIKIEDNSV